jgi:competence protein ComEC
MPFPFLLPAIALIAGIIAASPGRIPIAASLAALVASLAAAWIFFGAKKNRASFVLLLAAVLFFGMTLTSYRDHLYETNSLHTFQSDSYADFRGTVVRSPAAETDRDVLYIRVDGAKADGREIDVHGNMRLTVPRTGQTAPLPILTVGDRVAFSARVSATRDFNNFNAPFYARYLQGLNIHARAFVKSPLLVARTAPGAAMNPFRAISVLRRSLRTRLERHFPGSPPAGISPEGAILEALLLGDDGRMDADTVSSLQKTGLYHLFAISGAHIAIVSFLFFSLFKLIRIPKRPSYAILIVCLVLYALLVEGSPSVLRAVIMATAFLLGKLFWKDVHLVNTIAISAFALLIANPFSLFDPGFQLTFAATLSIILFYPRLIRVFPKLPLGISELTVMSITATLGVLPILVRDFNRVTFSALVLNYAAVPLVGLVMGAGYAFFPLAFAAPFLARPMALGLSALIRVFSWLSHCLDGIPFISYRIPTPPGFVVAGYFLFLLLLLAPSKFKRQKLLVAAGLAAFLVVLITYPFPSRSRDFKVTFLDVGQGDSILIEFPGTKKMLVDGGGFPDSAFDVGERVVSPFLWRKGIRRIDILVMTHAHPDHAGGLAAVARNFRIGEFWEADVPAPASAPADGLRQALGAPVPRFRISRGFSRREGDASIEVLHPAADAGEGSKADLNDLSAVLRLTFGRSTFLLPADIGRDAEAEIMASNADLRSLIFKSPHHGSATSSSEAFLERVRPEYAVISVGEGNRYGFPHPDILARYARSGARILRTDIDGAIEFASDGRSLRVRTAAAEYPKR